MKLCFICAGVEQFKKKCKKMRGTLTIFQEFFPPLNKSFLKQGSYINKFILFQKKNYI